MRRLPSIICLLGLAISLCAQSPHGPSLKMDCAACHKTTGWDIPADSWDFDKLNLPRRSEMTGMQLSKDTFHFNHYKTEFPLLGRHKTVDCRACHASLVFSEADADCISCHDDMHNQTVGTDCARCHNAENWLVNNITELHQANGFPLLGAHATANCAECHTSESALRFERIGNDCINCHTADFAATSSPNHTDAGFSTNCIDCHDMNGFDWSTDQVVHDFFPLTKGHDLQDCARCHTGGNYANTPNACFACHQADYEGALSPNHQSAGFPTDCATCHTTDPGWMPAQYLQHDTDHFPIYSGAHDGAWNQCVECHANESDYGEFTCTTCHTNPETDYQHADIGGYAYSSPACLACHPDGSSTNTFDHNSTQFPLTGAHTTVECLACHANGYQGTPTACAACHTTDFNQTANPSHTTLGFSTDCATCHTTAPDWMPATFANHNDYYALNGAHAAIANECATCHNGDYNNTPNTCFGCHASEYNQTANPNHTSAQFPTDCASCHSESSWTPTNFDHDGQYFPIYSGAHNGEWDQCIDCHTNPSNYAEVTCTNCHTNPETDNQHDGVGGYVYNSNACLACHPTGSADNTFDHNNSNFPLTGAHISIDCIECHANGYQGTPTECAACHTTDFNQTANPSHTTLGFSTDCATCHTTAPDWMPATFANHNDYYTLNGAHAVIANDCAACHNGDYNNTPNTCFGCHADNYEQTTNPNHSSANFPTDCASCHTENGWTPTNFDHDGQYFPIYSGAHNGEWDQCTDCHTNPSNYAEVTCTNCHTNPETDNQHDGVGGYVHNSNACLACHPTGSADNTFDHNNSNFPLTGAHISVDCIECHASGYQGTPTICAACHMTDFEQTQNPNHSEIGISTDCVVCHTTTPGWMPAMMPNHHDFYVLNGAHAVIANDCAACHNGDYNNTPNTCFGCHVTDYNQTTNPNHQAGQYPTDCTVCHSETAWSPSTFDHNATQFPLTGAHTAVDCIECHANGYQGTPTACAACHTEDYNQTANPNHTTLGFSTDCATCHTTAPDWMPATFANHNDYYTLNGAHAVIANDCAACHNGDYNNTPNTCFGCHADNYNQTTNPNHQSAQFPTDCASCHAESGWTPTTFDHDGQYFPIYSGAHNGEWDQCADCHTNPSNYAEVTCTNCHTNPETDNQHDGVGGYVYNSNACLACHPAGNADNPFDHNATQFPLTGAHTTVDCIECHANGYQNTPTQCVACHTSDFNQTLNPNHQMLGFSTDCASCHTTAPNWMPATMVNHNDYYVLNGAHAVIANDCATCHNGDYNNTPNTCFGCHAADYNQTTDPNHQAGQYPTDCTVCHTETAWSPSNFDHNATQFPLTGAHTAVDCIECHTNGYQGTPTQCAACHTADFNQTTNPNHQSLGFSTNCATCHTTAPDWMPANMANHDDFYILQGAHAVIASDCAACHNGDYNNTPNTCFGCHLTDYNQTTNPNHQSAQFPTDCAGCHMETSWDATTFDHDGQYFPIYSGAHNGEWDQCTDCHSNPSNYAEVACTNCHSNPETNNQHSGVTGYIYNNSACLACHPSGDATNIFNHNLTMFPLTGAHTTVECIACHAGGYQGTPTDCAACHTTDFNQTANPNHQALGFSTDCASCHTTAPNWMPATFANHNDYYTLNGAHAAIANDCATCHNGDYNNTPNTCFGCHAADYNQTTDPNHAAEQYPTDCTVCHTENAWTPATFDHNTTQFPLTGAHISVDCAACHANGYQGTPTACSACHTTDYNQTTNPNHNALGFSVNCATCHTTAPDWMPATFANHNDYYVLQGAHAAIANDCAACHNGDYNNTPNTCYGCHTADYNQANSPNHLSAGFPTDCATCHSQNAWDPSTFNHDSQYFPIYSGKHKNKWDQCSECHTVPNNFMIFSCIDCHEHSNQNKVNNDHQGVQGYSYNSMACYSCHPNGN